MSAPVELGHAWLPALLPAEATRFRVARADLARTLASAGAELVGDGADVEIAPPHELQGETPLALVPLDTPYVYPQSRLLRGALRAARSARVRAATRRAARALRRCGYDDVSVVPWDLRHPLVLPGGIRPEGRRLVEHLPQRAVVVGRRGPARQTMLERALEDAAAAGAAVGTAAPVVSGSLTVVGETNVFRLAAGPAERFLTTAAEAYDRIHAGPRAAELGSRLPRRLAGGRAGLALWSVERRLPGTPCPPTPPRDVHRACLDLAATLWDADSDRAPRSSPEEDGRAVAGAAGAGERVLAVGAWAAAETRHLTRGFAHRDFWTENVLVDGGRVSGLVDWEAATPGALPLGDFFQFRLNAEHPHGELEWGRVIGERLLPMLRAGGDETTRAFCARIGVPPEPRLLEALAAAYWLDRLAYQLTSYAERRRQPLFIERNVDLPAAAFGL